MNCGVEVREELTTAGHVVGGTTVEVPAVELVLTKAGVQKCPGSRLIEVKVGVGLGAEHVLLQLQEDVGEEQSCLVVIILHEMRCTSTLTSRLGAILRPVVGAITVEAGVVMVHLAFTARTSSHLSLLAAATVAALSLGLLLPPATRLAIGFLR
jgi:hypothetical protein